MRNRQIAHKFQVTTCNQITTNRKQTKAEEFKCLGCVKVNGMQSELQEPFHLQQHPEHFYPTHLQMLVIYIPPKL